MGSNIYHKSSQITEIMGICLAENFSSIKVMERCGFEKQFEGMGYYQGRESKINKYLYRV